MGARRQLWVAAACAAVLGFATRAWAETVLDPIARLTLEGGYDSNALYDGSGSDQMQRISPELGLRVHDELWDWKGSYRGDWLRYDRFAPGGLWNHAAALSLDATPTRRWLLKGALRGSYAFDPVGLAMLGIFRTGRQSALLVGGSGRAEYRLTPRVDVAGTASERTVRFDDGTGGAMHQPGVEALYRTTRRLSLGAAYQFGVFESFDLGRSSLAYANALKARVRWRESRLLTVEAAAGPAAWQGPDAGGERTTTALVPEASLELLAVARSWGLRVAVAHGLGIGSTARPALVDSFEFGGDRRVRRRWILHADGGIWRSGIAPSGRSAVTGWGVNGEAGILVGSGVRLSLAASHFGRLDTPAADLQRTTVGLRLGWALTERP
jgi:hypothetical protein